jgi:hypothetical protein
MKINEHTRISFLVENHPGAIDTLVSISSKFRKLKNPIFRKLLAKRATISMAAGIAGCSIESFYEKLKPLGFEKEVSKSSQFPEIITKDNRAFNPQEIIDLDVRDILARDRDPLPQIMKKLRSLQAGKVLRITNSFEPTPLMELLGKQGFRSFTEKPSPEIYYTYFYKTGAQLPVAEPIPGNKAISWDESIERFKGRLQLIDVRTLEMPGPMIAILEALEKLPGDKALFVFHKKFPLFLLPELKARNFDYVTNRVSDTELQILIYRPC